MDLQIRNSAETLSADAKSQPKKYSKLQEPAEEKEIQKQTTESLKKPNEKKQTKIEKETEQTVEKIIINSNKGTEKPCLLGDIVIFPDFGNFSTSDGDDNNVSSIIIDEYNYDPPSANISEFGKALFQPSDVNINKSKSDFSKATASQNHNDNKQASNNDERFISNFESLDDKSPGSDAIQEVTNSLSNSTISRNHSEGISVYLGKFEDWMAENLKIERQTCFENNEDPILEAKYSYGEDNAIKKADHKSLSYDQNTGEYVFPLKYHIDINKKKLSESLNPTEKYRQYSEIELKPVAEFMDFNIEPQAYNFSEEEMEIIKKLDSILSHRFCCKYFNILMLILLFTEIAIVNVITTLYSIKKLPFKVDLLHIVLFNLVGVFISVGINFMAARKVRSDSRYVVIPYIKIYWHLIRCKLDPKFYKRYLFIDDWYGDDKYKYMKAKLEEISQTGKQISYSESNNC